MRKILLIILILFVTLVSFSCSNDSSNNDVLQNNPQQPGESSKPGEDDSQSGNITQKPEDNTQPLDRKRTDNRRDAFIVCEADGTEISRHKSLYTAIEYCTTECGLDAYVCKIGESKKLFYNANRYDEYSADMFWYYTNVSELSRYTSFEIDHWNLLENSDEICVYKHGNFGEYPNNVNTITTEVNGYKLTSLGESSKANKISMYDFFWKLESSVIVKNEEYSGISKMIYNINLSESEIYPPYDDAGKTMAYLGVINKYNSMMYFQGLVCDTFTGEWFYFDDELTYSDYFKNYRRDNLILTSTWDDEKECYRPNADIKLTIDVISSIDSKGNEVFINKMNIELSNGSTFEFESQKNKTYTEFEVFKNMGFTFGLDIDTSGNDGSMFPNYMNGSKFENIVITSAKGYVYEDSITGTNKLYTTTPVLKEAGEYDLLNSNPASAARYHTLLYTPACINYDFSVAGRDVYSISYDHIV